MFDIFDQMIFFSKNTKARLASGSCNERERFFIFLQSTLYEHFDVQFGGIIFNIQGT
jgi:AAA+ ATPase superfamily predicted ATPase